MSKFATANCPYQMQPRTSVQLTVRAFPVVENYIVAVWADRFVSLPGIG